jgi:YidC/Oxa1 family membrane protein insertase
MGENRNLLVAFLLSAIVIFGWEYFFAMPEMKEQQHKQAQLAHQEKKETKQLGTAGAPQGISGHAKEMTRDAALKASGKRVPILTGKVDGSIRLTGATFDDLRLRDYHETIDKKSPEIVLLAPTSTKYPYLANFGWVGAPGTKTALPNSKTVWTQVGGNTLTEKTPVTLTWDNGQGLVFTRKIAVDAQYMFTITDTVTNKGTGAAVLYPYAAVTREGLPPSQKFYVLHEGFVGVGDGKLKDPAYEASDCTFFFIGCHPKPTAEAFSSTGGWAGITDKYWMAAVVPPQNEIVSAHAISQRGRALWRRTSCSPAPRSSRPCRCTNIATASRSSTWRSTGAGSGSSRGRSSGCWKKCPTSSSASA